MRQIRIGVFETNSSSTHTLVVCTDEELEKWKKGEIIYNYIDGFIPSDNSNISSGGETYEAFMDDEELEIEVYNYVTKGKENLTIFCKYGYNW
jgi:hypothetical protein